MAGKSKPSFNMQYNTGSGEIDVITYKLLVTSSNLTIKVLLGFPQHLAGYHKHYKFLLFSSCLFLSLPHWQ